MRRLLLCLVCTLFTLQLNDLLALSLPLKNTNPVATDKPVLFPHHVGEVLWIRWTETRLSDTKYRLFDDTGRLLRTGRFVAGRNAYHVSLKAFPAGMYMLWIEGEPKIFEVLRN